MIEQNNKDLEQLTQGNEKKPFYKKAWFIALVAFVVIGGIGNALGTGNDKKDDKKPETNETANNNDKDKEAEKEKEDAKEKEKDKQKEPGFGSVVEFDGLEIKFNEGYEFTVLENQFSELNGAEVIKIPVTVKNVSKEVNGLNSFSVDVYGPQGVTLSSVYHYFSDAEDNDVYSIAGIKALRPDVEVSAFMHVLYDGDGDYFISFDNFLKRVEVKLNIKK
ncbi:hypothetical protein G7062_09735 [Erysipelothrix sp. HDW6C]|uniref:hypothetical protein n=1 Tax=Erysipelothrix sp. HDW6C TaxID=2714930 RepID=UPI001409C6B6|nr:hypothetical protein [Erysipelothrix sp. HDW6C]QIK70564.1 hypothetical protein G7062_09735 [Erysipelothrix sp. HDW6C]